MWTRLRRIPISEHSGGLRQQEELGGVGGEMGDTVGFFTFTKKVKVILVLTLLLFVAYFIQCLKRTCVESARNKCFQIFQASNCSKRHIGDRQ